MIVPAFGSYGYIHKWSRLGQMQCNGLLLKFRTQIYYLTIMDSIFILNSHFSNPIKVHPVVLRLIS